ncbi:ankyrin [Microthyrium microscopicum]|uniref:Ankyrin n=1 Tax=Microthyrium microscopicum TaxID=703497 RepID=A0A6A6UBW4_9PEZI|nr:ankyrin [Microthyrium microscopicum]
MQLHFETELLEAVRENSASEVADLLIKGADPNAGLFGGETALSLAINNDSGEVLDLILQRGPLCGLGEEILSEQKPSVQTTSCQIPASSQQSLHKGFADSFLQTGRRILNNAATFQWRKTVPLGFLSFSPDVKSFPPYIHEVLDYALERDSFRLYLTESSINDNIVLRDGAPVMPLPWISPGEKFLYSLCKSQLATESMVQSVIQQTDLILIPFEESEVARKLLELAVAKCWRQLTRFLLDGGAPIDQATFLSTKKLRWPALSKAIAYAMPSESLTELSAQLFVGRPVSVSLNSPTLSREDSKRATFVTLVCSPMFRQLSKSDSEHDLAICMEMMDILYCGGANPLQKSIDGFDALSHLVVSKLCQKGIISHMLGLCRSNIESDTAISSQAKFQSPALYRIVHKLQPNLITLRLLLDGGISPDSEGPGGQTALFTAAYMNTGTDAIELLLLHKANPNNGGRNGWAPIIRSLDDNSEEKFEFLLNHGASPDGEGRDGKTILQEILEKDSIPMVLKASVVQSLLEHGASAYDMARQSSPALVTAVMQSESGIWSEMILDLLIRTIPKSQQQRLLDTALEVASSADFWLKSRHMNNTFMIFYLLRNGANPAAIRFGSDSLLHRIFETWGTWPNERDYQKDLKLLLNRRIFDVNAQGENGQVPLHHAVRKKDRNLTIILLDYGADPNILDVSGMTPLHHMCSVKLQEYNISQSREDVESDESRPAFSGVRGQLKWCHESHRRMDNIRESLEQEEMFQCLVDHGADLNLADREGRTLLMKASEAGNSILTANILYALGADRLVEEINKPDMTGMTALHLAAASGDVKTLRVLLNPSHIFVKEPNPWRILASTHDEQTRNSTVNGNAYTVNGEKQASGSSQGPIGWTSVRMSMPADVVLTIGYAPRKTESKILLPNVATSLWTMHTQPDVFHPEHMIDLELKTPLHHAAEAGNFEALELLVDFTNIDVDTVDNHGWTPADLALKNNHLDVYALLQSTKIPD